ncbi:MAG: SRPBCC family protein [Streptosporangiaceae bacterium]
MTGDPYRDSIHIAAEPELVFDYFTSATALARWMGDRAVVDPRPDGQFTIFFGDRRVEGHYLELDRPRRLVISWGRAGSASFPPGSSVLEVTLTPRDGGTLVAIAHSGLPGAERHRHADGWRHYLARLSLAAAGGEPAPHATPGEIIRGAG